MADADFAAAAAAAAASAATSGCDFQSSNCDAHVNNRKIPITSAKSFLFVQSTTSSAHPFIAIMSSGPPPASAADVYAQVVSLLLPAPTAPSLLASSITEFGIVPLMEGESVHIWASSSAVSPPPLNHPSPPTPPPSPPLFDACAVFDNHRLAIAAWAVRPLFYGARAAIAAARSKWAMALAQPLSSGDMTDAYGDTTLPSVYYCNIWSGTQAS